MTKKLELAKVIEALRNELDMAKQASAGATIRFNVASIDVEFETAVEIEGDLDLGGKIKFYVFDVDAKGSGKYKDAITHKIKLNLEPVDLLNRDPTTFEPRRPQIGGDAQPVDESNPKPETVKAGNHRLGGDG
jgi:hypothetical protein